MNANGEGNIQDGNLVKTKMERVPFSRASKTTEWQHGDSWDTVCSSLNTSNRGRLFLQCLFDGLYIDLNHFDVEWCYFLHDNRETTTVHVLLSGRRARRTGARVTRAGWLQSRANTNRRSPIKAYRCYNVTNIRKRTTRIHKVALCLQCSRLFIFILLLQRGQYGGNQYELTAVGTICTE